jgi:hypothetical protein
MATSFLSDSAVHGMLDSEFGTIWASLYLFVGNVFTATNATNLINDTSHGLSAGDCVMLKEVGTLPNGLSEGVLYFIINANANDFQLALTPGGSAVTFSDDGTGSNEWGQVPTLDGTGGTEASAGGYARQSVTIASAASRAKASSADVSWVASGADIGEVCAVGTNDASTAGNLQSLDPQAAYQTVLDGNTFRVSSGNLAISLASLS